MSILILHEDTRVTDVRIFKSHDDHPHEYIQGQFLFQVTDYSKTNGNDMVPDKISTLAPVPFGISGSQLSSRDDLFQLIHYSVINSRDSLFQIIYYSVLESGFSYDLTSKNLAEEITAKIMSRFRFITTTSCSGIIIAVNLDRTRYICHHILDDGDDEDMDDDDSVDDDDDDIDDDHDDDDHDDNENYDEEYQYNNSFSGFGEDRFGDIKGFSEVTGLVNVKPHEVLNSTDRCSICLEEYGSDFSGVAKAESSVCSHMFHRDCIQPWLRKFSNCCPLCRSVFIAQI